MNLKYKEESIKKAKFNPSNQQINSPSKSILKHNLKKLDFSQIKSNNDSNNKTTRTGTTNNLTHKNTFWNTHNTNSSAGYRTTGSLKPENTNTDEIYKCLNKEINFYHIDLNDNFINTSNANNKTTKTENENLPNNTKIKPNYFRLNHETKSLIISDNKYNNYIKEYDKLTTIKSYQKPEINYYPVLNNSLLIPINKSLFLNKTYYKNDYINDYAKKSKKGFNTKCNNQLSFLLTTTSTKIKIDHRKTDIEDFFNKEKKYMSMKERCENIKGKAYQQPLSASCNSNSANNNIHDHIKENSFPDVYCTTPSNDNKNNKANRFVFNGNVKFKYARINTSRNLIEQKAFKYYKNKNSNQSLKKTSILSYKEANISDNNHNRNLNHTDKNSNNTENYFKKHNTNTSELFNNQNTINSEEKSNNNRVISSKEESNFSFSIQEDLIIENYINDNNDKTITTYTEDSTILNAEKSDKNNYNILSDLFSNYLTTKTEESQFNVKLLISKLYSLYSKEKEIILKLKSVSVNFIKKKDNTSKKSDIDNNQNNLAADLEPTKRKSTFNFANSDESLIENSCFYLPLSIVVLFYKLSVNAVFYMLSKIFIVSEYQIKEMNKYEDIIRLHMNDFLAMSKLYKVNLQDKESESAYLEGYDENINNYSNHINKELEYNNSTEHLKANNPNSNNINSNTNNNNKKMVYSNYPKSLFNNIITCDWITNSTLYEMIIKPPEIEIQIDNFIIKEQLKQETMTHLLSSNFKNWEKIVLKELFSKKIYRKLLSKLLYSYDKIKKNIDESNSLITIIKNIDFKAFSNINANSSLTIKSIPTNTKNICNFTSDYISKINSIDSNANNHSYKNSHENNNLILRKSNNVSSDLNYDTEVAKFITNSNSKSTNSNNSNNNSFVSSSKFNNKILIRETNESRVSEEFNNINTSICNNIIIDAKESTNSINNKLKFKKQKVFESSNVLENLNDKNTSTGENNNQEELRGNDNIASVVGIRSKFADIEKLKQYKTKNLEKEMKNDIEDKENNDHSAVSSKYDALSKNTSLLKKINNNSLSANYSVNKSNNNNSNNNNNKSKFNNFNHGRNQEENTFSSKTNILSDNNDIHNNTNTTDINNNNNNNNNNNSMNNYQLRVMTELIILDLDFINDLLLNLNNKQQLYKSNEFIEFLLQKYTFKLLTYNDNLAFLETELSIKTKKNPYISNLINNNYYFIMTHENINYLNRLNSFNLECMKPEEDSKDEINENNNGNVNTGGYTSNTGKECKLVNSNNINNFSNVNNSNNIINTDAASSNPLSHRQSFINNNTVISKFNNNNNNLINNINNSKIKATNHLNTAVASTLNNLANPNSNINIYTTKIKPSLISKYLTSAVLKSKQHMINKVFLTTENTISLSFEFMIFLEKIKAIWDINHFIKKMLEYDNSNNKVFISKHISSLVKDKNNDEFIFVLKDFGLKQELKYGNSKCLSIHFNNSKRNRNKNSSNSNNQNYVDMLNENFEKNYNKNKFMEMNTMFNNNDSDDFFSKQFSSTINQNIKNRNSSTNNLSLNNKLSFNFITNLVNNPNTNKESSVLNTPANDAFNSLSNRKKSCGSKSIFKNKNKYCFKKSLVLESSMKKKTTGIENNSSTNNNDGIGKLVTSEFFNPNNKRINNSIEILKELKESDKKSSFVGVNNEEGERENSNFVLGNMNNKAIPISLVKRLKDRDKINDIYLNEIQEQSNSNDNNTSNIQTSKTNVNNINNINCKITIKTPVKSIKTNSDSEESTKTRNQIKYCTIVEKKSSLKLRSDFLIGFNNRNNNSNNNDYNTNIDNSSLIQQSVDNSSMIKRNAYYYRSETNDLEKLEKIEKTLEKNINDTQPYNPCAKIVINKRSESVVVKIIYPNIVNLTFACACTNDKEEESNVHTNANNNSNNNYYAFSSHLSNNNITFTNNSKVMFKNNINDKKSSSSILNSLSYPKNNNKEGKCENTSNIMNEKVFYLSDKFVNKLAIEVLNNINPKNMNNDDNDTSISQEMQSLKSLNSFENKDIIKVNKEHIETQINSYRNFYNFSNINKINSNNTINEKTEEENYNNFLSTNDKDNDIDTEVSKQKDFKAKTKTKTNFDRKNKNINDEYDINREFLHFTQKNKFNINYNNKKFKMIGNNKNVINNWGAIIFEHREEITEFFFKKKVENKDSKLDSNNNSTTNTNRFLKRGSTILAASPNIRRRVLNKTKDFKQSSQKLKTELKLSSPPSNKQKSTFRNMTDCSYIDEENSIKEKDDNAANIRRGSLTTNITKERKESENKEKSLFNNPNVFSLKLLNNYNDGESSDRSDKKTSKDGDEDSDIHYNDDSSVDIIRKKREGSNVSENGFNFIKNISADSNDTNKSNICCKKEEE